MLDVWRQGAKVGQPIILFRTSNSDPAEDFTVSLQGTVNEFATAGLLGTGAALAVLPSGTADDFASSIGVRKLDTAIRAIADANIVQIDVARIDAAATRRGEYCAVIDASDALDPHSLAAAGIDLNHLLWVRCSDDIQQKAPNSAKEQAGAPPLSRTLRQGG